jgi:hypothetical protein
MQDICAGSTCKSSYVSVGARVPQNPPDVSEPVGEGASGQPVGEGEREPEPAAVGIASDELAC